MKIVVTGLDENGRSVFVKDGPVEMERRATRPGVGHIAVWGDDAPPQLPSDGSAPEYKSYFPPEGGYRVLITEIPPGMGAERDPEKEREWLREMEQEYPGHRQDGQYDENQPGMHTTKTVDVGIVLDGELVLELDDGVTTKLQTGDCIIQNGTRHAWHNRGDRPVKAVFFIVGAHLE